MVFVHYVLPEEGHGHYPAHGGVIYVYIATR
jgi:hypothetical protein